MTRDAPRAERNLVSCLSDAAGAAGLSQGDHHGGTVMKESFWKYSCLYSERASCIHITDVAQVLPGLREEIENVTGWL